MVKTQEIQRLKLTLLGAVQGVGFRPFVYRLAVERGLRGWVANSSQGLCIEVEGPIVSLDAFESDIIQKKPPRSFIQSLESARLDPKDYVDFQILESTAEGIKTALILPDIAVCDECLSEIFDPKNRRYRYPFTNCTHCGPRFSIIEALPYDRANTSMKDFVLCRACQAEYEDPANRRYHAQPNACSDCGPHLELRDSEGRVLAEGGQALDGAIDFLLQGKIGAVKGLGGFHLLASAVNEETVGRLRDRKHRQEKPFALMIPTIEMAKSYCEISDIEERALNAPEAPIVILKGRISAKAGVQPLASSIAPQNPNLGVMLPYTPLHHLLMRKLDHPMIATSGNLSEEPIVTDEMEALTRLAAVADFYLVHNRPIIRPVDDSIVRVMSGRQMILRRGRGFAPLPFESDGSEPSVLAVGAHQKNTVAQSIGGRIFVSQHIGDLATEESARAFKQAVKTFEQLYDAKPDLVASDIHPDYLSTKFAESLGLAQVRVQHHYAHCLSCMAENELRSPVLGVAWDGTGAGEDGTLWGGEFLLVGNESFDRLGHFRTFRLAGSERAIQEPRRSALGLLYEIFGDTIFDMKTSGTLLAFSTTELSVLGHLLKKGLNAPTTSSAGRLFDAVSSIVGLCQAQNYEGQAAMALEFAIDQTVTDEDYSTTFFKEGTTCVFDWEPMVREILFDMEQKRSVGRVAAKFHNTLAQVILKMAFYAKESKIVLTGGCFQNRYLLERTIRVLTEQGFKPYWHQRIPTNDGGISLGQTVAALRHLNNKRLLNSRKMAVPCA